MGVVLGGVGGSSVVEASHIVLLKSKVLLK